MARWIRPKYKHAVEYQKDWNAFARDILGVRLDRNQRKILKYIQSWHRVTIRSGHAVGKDYLGAVAALCFLYLNDPCKVVVTAPTGRQVISIMMSEIAKIHGNARVPLGGEVLTNKIKFEQRDKFLEGFKSSEKDTEAWQGYHSPNLMVVVTEASGIEQTTFEALEGILTGNSKLILVGNPIRPIGEFYQSFKNRRYKKFHLSCLDSPNVRAKKILIPGQVDYDWVVDKIETWCIQIDKEAFNPDSHDFKWEGKYYRPNDLFVIKVIGDYVEDSENKLIPLSWLESAVERWHERNGKGYGNLHLGVDVAGMGRDETVFAFRKGNTVEKLKSFSKQDHMQTAGKIINELKLPEDADFIDTIGEGAGVHSRLIEQKINSVSVKFSESAEGLTDKTGERKFANMRAYCYWAVRDALDPQFGGDLALPPDDILKQELNEITFFINSSGKIQLEKKDDIKARLGRSPDRADAVALSFGKMQKVIAASISLRKKIT